MKRKKKKKKKKRRKKKKKKKKENRDSETEQCFWERKLASRVSKWFHRA